MKFRAFKLLILLISITHLGGLGFLGCATPQMPTGGPEDTEPPRIVSANPPENSVQIRGSKIEWTFSEYVSHSTFQRALSITPNPPNPPQIKWKGKNVILELDSLKQNTTYILKLDAGLSDIRNVALKTPILYAFSTGNQIDSGVIKGIVRNIEHGKGEEGMTVGLYRRTEVPDFTTKTDNEGHFTFRYLPADSFFVAVLLDKNRNAKVDEGERYGVLGKKILPDSTQTQVIWAGVLDTQAPQLQRARILNERQVQLRFSEPIQFSSNQKFTLTDSLEVADLQVHLFQAPNHQQELLLQSLSPLRAGKYQLKGVFQDSLGNLTRAYAFRMTAAKPDTTTTRFLGFSPANGVLGVGMQPKVWFSGAFRAEDVFVTDTSGVEIEHEFQPATYSVIANQFPLKITVRLQSGKDSTQTFTKLIGKSRLFGQMEGFRWVQLLDLNGKIIAQKSIENNVFEFTDLVAENYQLRFYENSQNGVFQIGSFPFGQSEQVMLSKPIVVPANWEVEWKPE